jgi:hypothetical protein
MASAKKRMVGERIAEDTKHFELPDRCSQIVTLEAMERKQILAWVAVFTFVTFRLICQTINKALVYLSLSLSTKRAL